MTLMKSFGFSSLQERVCSFAFEGICLSMSFIIPDNMRRAFCAYPSASKPSARPHVNDMVSPIYGIFIMFNDYHCIS